MKKAITIMLFLGATSSMFGQSNAPLTNGIDSVSYALGNQLEKGLSTYLVNLKVIQDTASIRTAYTSRIDAETNESNKKKLEEELNTKLDSANTANTANMSSFIKGMKSVMINNQTNDAYKKGVSVGSQITLTMLPNLKQEALAPNEEVNISALFDGLYAALNRQPSAINNPGDYIKARMEQRSAETRKEKIAASKDVIEAGEKFLAANKKKKGVVTLPDGLQYKIITKGTGEIPTSSSEVKVHYTGRFLDGKVFDSSVDHGAPVDLNVAGVIKGWSEALQLMPVGSKWTIYVPYQLAYGENQTGPIPACSTLIFDIQLLQINK